MGSLAAEASILLAPSAVRRLVFWHPSPGEAPIGYHVGPRRWQRPGFQLLVGRLPGPLQFLDVGDAQRRPPSYSNAARRLETRHPFGRGVHILSTLGREASSFLPPSPRPGADRSAPHTAGPVPIGCRRRSR